MTDAERLAIAEEIASIAQDGMLPMTWDGFTFKRSLNGGGKVLAYGACENCNERCLGEFPSFIDAVYHARQKLDAEREAKKSERERRLEKTLTAIRDFMKQNSLSMVSYSGMKIDDLNEALKEST